MLRCIILETATDPAYHYVFSYDYETVDGKITSESIKEDYDLLKSSGYFKAINCGGELYSHTPKDKAQFADEILEFNKKYDRIVIDIRYYSEDYYNYAFSGNPPVPYSELTGGNYVVCGMDYVSSQEYGIDYPIDFEANGSFTAFSYKRATEDELTEADREIAELVYTDDRTGESIYEVFREVMTGNIIAGGENRYEKSNMSHIVLIGCIEDYFSLIDGDADVPVFGYSAVLNDELSANLEKADMLVTEYDEDNDSIYCVENLIVEIVDNRRISSACKIIGFSLIILVMITALINEINIISTGILNRRREIAALRSLGMERGQLAKTLLIECGLYSVISALATVVIFEPLLYLLNNADIMGMKINFSVSFSYFAPIVSVLLVLVPVLLVGIITTFVSAAGFGRNPISEEMKTVE